MHPPINPDQPPRSLPDWQLPAGVARGTWDYLQSPSIATDYDEFHAGHPLLALDQQLIEKHLPQPGPEEDSAGLIVDLGCGTGRNLLRLASIGWNVLGVDLSQAMLDEVHRKCQNAPFRDRVQTLHANMVELQNVPDQSANGVLCMYSSLGMVRGRQHRRHVLHQVRRILKPKGKFFVHVHNRGSWLRDPRGIRQTLQGWLKSRYTTWELGDRIYPYRGLPNMFLHVFSHRELKQDLHQSGLTMEQFYVLNRESSALLARPWFGTHLRAGGFLAVSSREV